MNSKLKRRITALLVVAVVIYLVGGIVLYSVQELILFHPKSLPKEHKFSFDQPFEELNIPFGKDNLNIVKFKTSQQRRGIILFFHGNMENVEHYKKYSSIFTRNDYEVWMIDYPGFGKTTGNRSEKIMNEQALVMYDLATKEIGSDSLIIYGKSIGTGVASYVAANENCKQLILETPYYSIPALAKHYFPIYPTASMIKYSFPIHQYLKKVHAPITILHGTDDEIVPYKNSKWLKEENQKANLITIEKGRHNNLSEFPLFHSAIDSLLH